MPSSSRTSASFPAPQRRLGSRAPRVHHHHDDRGGARPDRAGVLARQDVGRRNANTAAMAPVGTENGRRAEEARFHSDGRWAARRIERRNADRRPGRHRRWRGRNGYESERPTPAKGDQVGVDVLEHDSCDAPDVASHPLLSLATTSGRCENLPSSRTTWPRAGSRAANRTHGHADFGVLDAGVVHSVAGHRRRTCPPRLQTP